jgi:hypothetical protein
MIWNQILQNLCESNILYCLLFKVCIGDPIIDPDPPVSTNVVANMCKPFFDKGFIH